jgi:hypothetical protein
VKANKVSEGRKGQERDLKVKRISDHLIRFGSFKLAMVKTLGARAFLRILMIFVSASSQNVLEFTFEIFYKKTFDKKHDKRQGQIPVVTRACPRAIS